MGWLSQTFLYSVKVRILFFTAFACIYAIHFTQNWSIEETQDLALSVNVEVNRDLALRNWTATIYYIQCDNSILTLIFCTRIVVCASNLGTLISHWHCQQQHHYHQVVMIIIIIISRFHAIYFLLNREKLERSGKVTKCTYKDQFTY